MFTTCAGVLLGLKGWVTSLEEAAPSSRSPHRPGCGGGAVWGDAAGKFVRGGVGARGGDFIVLLQRQNVV